MFYSKNPKKNIMASTKHQDFFNIDDIKRKNQQNDFWRTMWHWLVISAKHKLYFTVLLFLLYLWSNKCSLGEHKT